MNCAVVRPVRPGELSAVAELRWQWVRENAGTPTTSRDDFVRRFVAWAQENQNGTADWAANSSTRSWRWRATSGSSG